jgi:hypothetical protein
MEFRGKIMLGEKVFRGTLVRGTLVRGKKF